MKPTLQQLFYGDLCPQQDVSHTEPGCPTSYEEIERSQKRFLEKLKESAPELEARFKVLENDFYLAYTSDTEEMFRYGFGLAVKLLAEALAC